MPPAPASEPRVAVSADGRLIAHVESDKISLVDGASLDVVGEIGVDPEAEGCDVALTGEPTRLVVLSRYAGSARLHLIDPAGPSALGELALRAATRLVAASGDHVWLGGPGGVAVVDVARREPTLVPLPLRGAVAAVGAFADGRFVVSTGGLLEEWDPVRRAPARRFRLARPTAARFVGGGARQVWMVPAEGDRIELIPLAGHAPPTKVELPEPPARIAADAGHDRLVVLGARTGTGYLVELGGRGAPVALESVSGSDVAWLDGGALAVVDAVSGLGVVTLGGGPRPTVSERPAADRPAVERPAPPRPAPATPTAPERAAPPRPVPRPAPPTTSADPAQGERARVPVPRDVGPLAGATTTWRDELATWARAVRAGARAEVPALRDGPAVLVAERLGLQGWSAHALWLAYGARLGGVDELAATELLAVIGRRWDEALGRGQLATSGALRWRRGRIALRGEVARALDERAPRGTLLTSEVPLTDHAIAVVAEDDADLDALAAWAAPQLGPLLVPDARGRRRPGHHRLEARVRGALAVQRWSPAGDDPRPAPLALLVVDDPATARAADVPVLGTWPPDE